MYIKQIVIKETAQIEKIIRKINFKLGLNFIVDAGKNQEKGNSVGKTTILKLIDIALGAKERKYIYYDGETKKTNIDLERYIDEKKVQVELLLVDSFNESSNEIILAVDLFSRGKRYINGNPFNLKEYVDELNMIFFSNSVGKPSFRQLIKMFVRIDQQSDNNKFLRFLTNTNDVTYENIYYYLFNLQNQNIANRILKLKQDIKAKEAELRSYMKSSRIQSIDAVNQKINLLENKIREINQQIDILVDSKKFKENEESIAKIKIQYAKLNDDLDRLFFQKERISGIIENSEYDISNIVDESILQILFSEVSGLVSNLDKEFADLVQFNKELIQNKLKYFRLQLAIKEKRIDLLKSKKDQLFSDHKSVIMLIEENKVEEYTLLKNELEEYREELGKNKNIENTHTSISNSLNTYKNELKCIEKASKVSQNTLSIFNSYFSDFSEKTNGEPFMLYKTEETFPFGIDYVKKGLSTGTRKSIIAAFDLAYQKFSEKINKKVPNFIIYDVIETIDQKALKAIVDIVHDVDCQYIVAVLQEKISEKDFISKDDISVVLSESERPFKM
ncbi:TPA: DUF2326 domain-containing protein [Streptococcus suis]|nr:DUF2326 domain-containing protein [Streptococcus suis]